MPKAQYNNFVIIRNIKFCDDSVGIIDTYISEKYDNVIEKNAVVHGKKIKHGDLLIEFLRDCGYNGQIYYYAAIDQDNRIIVWNNGLAYYKGNSYLSLYTMLKKV